MKVKENKADETGEQAAGGPEAAATPPAAPAPKVPTYRALKGFSWPLPKPETGDHTKADGTVVKNHVRRSVHVEEGSTKVSVPEAHVEALLAMGAIEKEG
jgi:hypothetical protein